MTKKETLKQAQEKLEKERAQNWINCTVKEVARIEGVSEATALLWMKKHGIEPDTEVKRRYRARKDTWKGLTCFEIKETLEPHLSITNIRAYARNHGIELKSPGRGRPKKKPEERARKKRGRFY